MHASIRDLHARTKELLDAARRGEKVIVTYRDKDYIQLVPLKNEVMIEENAVFGMWADNPKVADVNAFVDQLRKPRHVD